MPPGPPSASSCHDGADRMLGRHRAVCIACAVLALCAAGASAGLASPGPVAVEVYGFAEMAPGLGRARAHAAALADARRNALIQAHAAVQARTVVAGRRVAEQSVCVCAAGYVREMHVLEAGGLPETEPAVYRVRARALVHPLDARPGDPLTPAVCLDVPSDAGAGLRMDLARELERCGLRVVEPGGTQPAIHLAVALAAAPEDPGATDGGEAGQEVSWALTAGRPGDPSASHAAGSRVVPAGPDGVERALPPLALEMARAVLRLWFSPRRTRVRIPEATGSEAEALRAAAAEAALPGADPGGPGVVFDLQTAGSPDGAVRPILARAGLAGRFALREACLQELVYVRLPAVAEAAADAP